MYGGGGHTHASLYCLSAPPQGSRLSPLLFSHTHAVAPLTSCPLLPFLPQLLSELVLVSAEAASLTGTTAALVAGEVYTVADLLYGMLLPSGNDAAAALAEYLGDGFAPPERSRDRNPHPVDRFVAEMNREAARCVFCVWRYWQCVCLCVYM